jgi:uncharacterized protein with NAD-binding domain and iron-sulfur cluster
VTAPDVPVRKVAIFGGGMAGLAAAWSLSRPGRPEQVEVTVYQRGWRLGGKAASGRGVHGRVEEHGLHLLLGYYDNVFHLLREVYAELDRTSSDPASPLRTWRDAFSPLELVGLGDPTTGAGTPWVARFRSNRLEPGSATVAAADSPAAFVGRGVALLFDFLASLQQPAGRSQQPEVVLSASPTPPAGSTTPSPDGDLALLLRRAPGALRAAAEELARLVEGAAVRGGPVEQLLAILDAVRRAVDASATRPGQRRVVDLADLVTACLRGALRDGLLAGGDAYATIDHLDFREWLALHGARERTLRSPLVRGMYDFVFAYEEGDHARPRFSAGLGLFLSMRFFFDYKGSLFWRMEAGMGDVVVAPLYQALRARGVRFEFFHRLDRVHVAGGRLVGVRLGRQAQVTDGDYDPLVRVRGLPCFPSAPKAELLRTAPSGDPESQWSNRDGEEPVWLEAGTDFDDAVLAVSLGMVPFVCADLVRDDPRWRRMVETVATVPTQSLQVWLRADERALGSPAPGATLTGYPTPFDTYASMSHLLAGEEWPPDEMPGSLAYFCSVTADSEPPDPARARAAVRDDAVELLARRADALWPGAYSADGFDWRLLCGGGALEGAARVDSQYWSACVDPSDRYVQSLPGTGVHRLRADQSGVDNLALAGDWTNCGLNAGCLEAAVMSGLQAANVVSGERLTAGLLGSWYGLPS